MLVDAESHLMDNVCERNSVSLKVFEKDETVVERLNIIRNCEKPPAGPINPENCYTRYRNGGKTILQQKRF